MSSLFFLLSSSPLRYGQIAAILNEEGLLSPPVTISFKNLGLEMGPKRLLHNVSGIIRPGEVCCVLGAPDSVRSRLDPTVALFPTFSPHSLITAAPFRL